MYLPIFYSLLFVILYILFSSTNLLSYSFSSFAKELDESNIECSSTINQNIKLTADLDCISNGLTIKNQNDLIFDLNGYSITGSGNATNNAGLRIVESNNITIKGNGTIQNFQAGILANTSENIDISSTNFENNSIGVFLVNSEGSAIENSIYQTNNIGITILLGFENWINNNFFNSNDNAGLTMVSTSESIVLSNEINGSRFGIFLDSQSKDNFFQLNSLSKNWGADIVVIPKPSVNSYSLV